MTTVSSLYDQRNRSSSAQCGSGNIYGNNCPTERAVVLRGPERFSSSLLASASSCAQAFSQPGRRPLTQTVNPASDFYHSRILYDCRCGYCSDLTKPWSCPTSALRIFHLGRIRDIRYFSISGFACARASSRLSVVADWLQMLLYGVESIEPVTTRIACRHSRANVLYGS